MSTTIFINGRFLAQRLTGVQRYAHETLRALDSLLAERPGGALRFEVLAPPDAPRPQLSTVAFRRVGKLRGNAWEQLVLPLASRGGMLLGFGPTGPVLRRSQVVTIHDAAVRAFPDAFSLAFRSWYGVLLPLLVRRARLVMTVSRFSEQELVERLGARRERLRVGGEGWQHVLRIPSDPSILSAHDLKPKGYVLAVGSVTPHKNLAVVARAAALLRNTSLELVVAGAVNPRVFGAQAVVGAPRIKRLGYVSDGQLRALYANAAVFVYPSLYEGFGIPPLEAMALGCPVIASRRGAIPEVCGDAALYFEPHDEAELAARIEELTASAELSVQLAERARAQLARHSWRKAAERQLALLEEVLVAHPADDVSRHYSFDAEV